MTATAESTARRYEQHERRVESGHRADVAPDCPRPTRSMFAGRSTWSYDCDCPSCTERRAASRAASAAASVAAARTRAERAKTATAEVNAGAWTAKDAHDGHLPALGVPASVPAAPAAPHLADGGGAGWRDHALCARLDADPEDWFPDGGRYGEDTREAIEACTSCPVRITCLETALEHEAGLPREMRYGVWGGLNPRERAAMDPGRRPPGGQTGPDCPESWGNQRRRSIDRHLELGEQLCGPCARYDLRSRARVERDDQVALLAAEGNTAWQIALATGEPYSTVRRVLARVSNPEANPLELVFDGQVVLGD